MNSSIFSSANCHMKSSFFFICFGVKSRHMRPRYSSCWGGSIVTMNSCIGSSVGAASMTGSASSPSTSTGRPGNGPVGELHDEYVAWSRSTSDSSSCPVTTAMS